MASSTRVTRRIQAPVNVVWDLATDIPGSADVISGISSVKMLTDGEFQVGTRWIETRRMFGKEATEEMWVSAVESLRSYVVEAESHGSHYHSVITFVPTGAHSTDATFEFSGRPLTLPAKILAMLTAPLMNRAVRDGLAKDLADIATAAEQRSRR